MVRLSSLSLKDWLILSKYLSWKTCLHQYSHSITKRHPVLPTQHQVFCFVVVVFLYFTKLGTLSPWALRIKIEAQFTISHFLDQWETTAHTESLDEMSKCKMIRGKTVRLKCMEKRIGVEKKKLHSWEQQSSNAILKASSWEEKPSFVSSCDILKY